MHHGRRAVKSRGDMQIVFTCYRRCCVLMAPPFFLDRVKVRGTCHPAFGRSRGYIGHCLLGRFLWCTTTTGEGKHAKKTSLLFAGAYWPAFSVSGPETPSEARLTERQSRRNRLRNAPQTLTVDCTCDAVVSQYASWPSCCNVPVRHVNFT